MTVYVPQRPVPNGKGWTPDLSPLEEFGDIVYVFDVEDNLDSSPDSFVEICQEIIINYDPSKDFICYPGSGSRMGIYILMVSLFGLGIKDFKFLEWDREKIDGVRTGSGYYTARKLTATNYFK